ncbi:MAG: BON domain-containing protein [Bryobacteraceae bacterium]|nr:BON domain-containing protein [Bryobacterales bacterium]MEB2361061.1 BON domain-containing protein [Bryobacterales bacterium]NUN01106.1 BON domain-containing protein [Bryobacteraceae bacterium]
MKRTFCAIVLILICFLPLAAQSKTAKHVRQGGAAAVAPDAQIEDSIRQRFAKSRISTNNFTVRVQGGVATIEGRTNVVQHKGTATRLAKAAGARRVVNNIKISDEARARAAGNLEKNRRRVQVRRSEVTR